MLKVGLTGGIASGKSVVAEMFAALGADVIQADQIAHQHMQQNGYVTFGSFNNFNKIDRPCIELWAQLLRAVPDSRLLMVTVPEGESRQRLTEQFAARGVAPERLEFHGKLPASEFHRMLQRVDLTLDPVTVNGATTTCESLWLGVPVISLVGTRFLERAGLSILSAAGMHDFAAATPQDASRLRYVSQRTCLSWPHCAWV